VSSSFKAGAAANAIYLGKKNKSLRVFLNYGGNGSEMIQRAAVNRKSMRTNVDRTHDKNKLYP